MPLMMLVYMWHMLVINRVDFKIYNHRRIMMKIAIPVEEQIAEGDVCASFGRTPFYLIYNSDNQEINYVVNSAAAASGGAGIKAAQLLVDIKVDAVITPRIGKNSAEVLQGASIKIFKSNGDSIQKNISQSDEGALELLSDFHAGFHGHGGQE